MRSKLFKQIIYIFSAIYQVLQFDNQSIYVSMALSFIQMFQLIYLAFALKTSYLWNNTQLTHTITQFLSYFTILLHIVNTDFSIFLAFLYFFFSIVLVTIMLLFLVGILDKDAPIILIKILGYLLKFLLTIGYFPLMQIFFGYLACHEKDGIQVMVYLNSQVCWTFEYSIHAIFAILSLILSQGLISIVSLICYQSKKTQMNAFSQRTGRPYSFYHYCILINIMTYQLLETPQYISVILIVFLINSYLLFYLVKSTQPFHDKNIQTLWVIITALNFWTSFMLTFAAILEGYYFRKSLYAWLIGIPFLTIIIIREPSEQVDLFAANIHPHESGDHIIQLCEYLLNMIQNAHNDHYIQLELDAYIEVHKNACPKPDCVLKARKQTEKKKSTRQGNQILLDVINQIFFYGIKNFPTDTHLRLHYAYFLMDYLKLKQLALTELQQAEQSNVSFDFSFIIFRFKKIIEEELQQQQQESSIHLDVSNEMTFLAQSKQLMNMVERTALLFIDFWSQLQEEMPDTGKLLYLGTKIQQFAQIVEDQWKRIKKLNQKHKKLYLLMGKYYKYVWNDEIKSQQMFEIEKNNKNSEFKGLYILDEMGNSSQAILVCQTEGDQLGIIQSINKAACSLLGYTKTDLVGRHLKILQPKIYSKWHTTIMTRFLENSDLNQLQEAKEQGCKIIFVKNKAHYIIQCLLQVKIIQTQNQEIYLMAQLIQDVQFKPYCYILCQSNGQIENINSMCIKVLGIDNKIIEMKRLNINDLFPNFMDIKEDYQTRQGEKLVYTPSQKLSKDLDFIKYSSENIQLDLHEQTVFNCQVTEIQFNFLASEKIENRVFGYIIKLDLIKPQTNGLQVVKKQLQQQQWFKFIPQNIYQLEKVNITDTIDNSIKFDSSIIWESAQKQSEETVTQEQVKQQEETNVLAQGIRTVRLLRDKLVDIDDQQPEEEDEESQNNQIILAHQDDLDEEQSVLQLNQNYSSKSLIETEIKQSLLPSINKKMQMLINTLLVIIIICIFTEYFLGTKLNDDLQMNIPYLRQNNERVAIFLLLQSVIQDLKFLNYGYSPLQQILTNNTFIQIQRNNFKINLAQIEELELNLSLAEVTFIQEYEFYETEFKSLNVQMKNYYGDLQNYTLSETIEQLISVAIKLNNSDLTEFNDLNPLIFYFEFNSYNSLALAQHISQNYYYYNILSKSSLIDRSVNTFLIIISFMTFILFLASLCYFYQIYHNKLEIIQLFLDIKENQIKQIYNNCELFLTDLQIGDDDLISEAEEKPVEKGDEAAVLNFRPKRRKHKDSSKEFQNQLFISFILNLLIFFYFLFLEFQVEIVVSQVQRILPVLNLTSSAEVFNRFADNALRQFIYDPSYLIYNNNGIDELRKITVQLYDIDAEIHQLHTDTWDLFEEKYKTAFYDIFINNPCSIIASIESTVTEPVCNSFYGGIMQNGLSIGITKFVEDLRQTIQNFENRNSSQKQVFDITDDPDLNTRINLINTISVTSMRRMQKIFIRACYRYLISIMESTILQHFDQTDVLRLAVFLCINILLLIGVIFVWIPVQLKNNQDILTTRLLILMIPLDLILRIKSIKNYLRNKIYH
ncbi:unnamed protein product (macronuclear) [Paramecium tetraurelia]|uniref:PAS domain-containing protein n=1 Tax=Paramecium tetraurelia TaxID=5888 RepID=A0C9F0_PARTE|nr:uncharacterized protein GSPATT00006723001 [Paramecium tetraurelia]CAK67417.1 unnamed protein product [Paramecium tetraurelia]|eukprot:XP_001434814.1 hypothetical protein (macronuclear) [Paramecium tetraurelia strain d4-2]